ncbi:MAG: hypothetical protein M1837_001950 [Sclerophora amabilis]|nr:MAG: hypothetical protein M1837_001950 [Sclerophora amabilis]
MFFGLVWYTLLVVSLNRVASGGGSNLLTEEEIAILTPETTEARVVGSKWVLVSEEAMLGAIWSMKTCMLIIYARVTYGLLLLRRISLIVLLPSLHIWLTTVHVCNSQGTKHRKFITALSVYVALSFVGSQLALFLSCRPLAQYWAVPAPDPQCSTYQHYEIAQACFNITGDLMMLAIAVPLLMSIRLPTQQKLVLVVIFGMGAFVIVAALCTKIYCLVPHLIDYVYMNWYIREATVALYVTNSPFLWTLIRELFPRLRTWSSSGSRSNSKIRLSTPREWRGSANRKKINLDDSVELGGGTHDEIGLALSDSQERIKGNNDEGIKPSGDLCLQIKRDVTFTVERDPVDNKPMGMSDNIWS